MSTEETPQKILDAVQTVISREGVRGTSLRLVAEEAGVSLGLLSYHFKDKDSLIIAAFQSVAEPVRRFAEEAVMLSSDPSERWQFFTQAMFTPQILDGPFPRLLVSCWAMALTDPDVSAMLAVRRDRTAIETLIAAARPDLSSAEVSVRAADVLLEIDGLWFNWAQFGDRPAVDRGLRRLNALVLK